MNKIFKIGLFVAAIAACAPAFGMLTAIQKMPDSYKNNLKKDRIKLPGLVMSTLNTRSNEKAQEAAFEDAFLPKELVSGIVAFMSDADRNQASASCKLMREKLVDPRILEAQSYFQGDKKWQTFQDAWDAQDAQGAQMNLGEFTQDDKDYLIALGCTEDDLADKDRFAKKIKENNSFIKSFFQFGQLIDQNESDQKHFDQAVSFAVHSHDLKGLKALFERNKDTIKQECCSQDGQYKPDNQLYSMYANWVKEAIKKNNFAAFAFMIESDPLGLNNYSSEVGPIMDDVDKCLSESKREIDWLYKNTCLNSGCKSREKPWFGGIFNGCTIF